MKSNLGKGPNGKHLSSILQDTAYPPHVRAELLILRANEKGFDTLKQVAKYIERNDSVKELEEQNAELTKKLAAKEKEIRPLQPEIFLEKVDLEEGTGARILCQSGPMICPMDEAVGKPNCGEYVLVERGTGRVVARDTQVHPAGEIVRVDSVPDEEGGQAIVKLRDQRFTAYLSDAVRHSSELKPGAEAVYDPQRQFLHRLLKTNPDGSDLLTPLSELSEFTLESLGAPNPVIEKIMRVFQRDLYHPGWREQLPPRKRHSFLFYGPSGGGKTSTIKVIGNLLSDLVEELTGHRESRIVFCDISKFYSPYMGESEQKITSWFEKLAELSRRPVITKDGKEVHVPLLVVFEEADSILRQRGEMGSSSHLFDRLLSLILMKMDAPTRGLDGSIIFISSTNKKELLDFASHRRFAEREVLFGTLNTREALAVLEKKITSNMRVRTLNGEKPAVARDALLRAVVQYLYGGGEDQVLAEAVLRNSTRKPIRRGELVTGAILEMAVSEAIDETLDRSTDENQLLGLDAASIIDALEKQFQAIATSLRVHNIRDYAPHLFTEEESQLSSVTPRRHFGRQPAIVFNS